jgi:hypothetical protein
LPRLAFIVTALIREQMAREAKPKKAKAKPKPEAIVR